MVSGENLKNAEITSGILKFPVIFPVLREFWTASLPVTGGDSGSMPSGNRVMAITVFVGLQASTKTLAVFRPRCWVFDALTAVDEL
jgi:hypothetical protein